MDEPKEKAIRPSESSISSLSSASDSASRHSEIHDRKLLVKCDLHIMPVLFILYVLVFMDRINIGNAKILGLTQELNMSGSDYNIALLVFFPLYILAEVPSNMIMRKIRPSTWLSGLIFTWGIITVLQGITQSFGGLVACRVFLGLVESGFLPGCVLLISSYYPRYQLQWRLSLLFCAGILAGAFAGLFAYAISHMEGIAGLSGWRWLFIIEGLVTVVAAVFAKFAIVDWPEQTSFLTSEERVVLLRRLWEDQGGSRNDKLGRRDLLRILRDWKIYAAILMYLGITNTGYAGPFFLPTILNELGWTAVRAQVMSIPVYLVAAVLSLLGALGSDMTRNRSAFIFLGIVVGTVGYAMLLGQTHLSTGVKYFATFLVMSGCYIAQPITIGWLSNVMGSNSKRAVGTAMQVGVGNLGGIVASTIFLSSQAPRYPLGYGLSLGLFWVAAAAAGWMLLGTQAENKARDRGERDHRLSLPSDQLDSLGDEHPHFRYSP